jgi:hypothetical protein
LSVKRRDGGIDTGAFFLSALTQILESRLASSQEVFLNTTLLTLF